MDEHTPNERPEGALTMLPRTIHGRGNYLANSYVVEAEDADREVGLFEYWTIIRRNTGKILLCAIAGMILGFLVGIPMKSVYRAKTTIEVLAMNAEFLNMRGATPVNGSNDSDVSEEQTQAALLTSSSLIKRVAARLGPDDVPVQAETPQAAKGASFIPAPLRPALKSLFPFPPSKPVNPRSVLLAKAVSTLKVRANPHTRLIEATVDSADPKLAADFLNILSEEFIQQNQESRLSTTARTSDWLSHELSGARDQLRASEDALHAYADNSGIVYTNDTVNVASERLQQYQQALSASTADRISKQSRNELALRGTPDSLADVINDASLRETQTKMIDLKRQIADLSIVYKPEYAKIRRLQAELESLQLAFNSEREAILSRIKTDYEEAARKERLLGNAYEGQIQEVTAQGGKSIQYNILKREVDSNRQLYDTMLQQTKAASIASALQASNVRVVDPADEPNLPVFPNFPLNSAIGLVAGLMISVVVVLVRDEMDSTFQSPGEIRKLADIPELGVIPNAAISDKAYHRDLKLEPAGSYGRTNARFDRNVRAGRGSTELNKYTRPTLLDESFRAVLTSILFGVETASRPRVLVISSASPGEGKTTSVSNLARAAAQLRMKVLVIDADLRRPRMHSLFDLSNLRGLTDVLQTEVLNKDALAGIVQETGVPNLHVLTAGPESTDTARLLYSVNFATLIEKFRNEYDMVLIDTPPMLKMTDARIVCRHADAVVLVARAGQTSRGSLVAAKERFSDDRVRVLGGILNDWDLKRGANQYYYSRR